jgi:hypothetical protein
MAHVSHRRLGGQIARVRREAAGGQGLPFSQLLDRREVEQVFETHAVRWRQGVFTPLVTLYAFLGQVLDADGSCRATVARVLAWLIGRGEHACSARTGGYCQARARLPESALHALMQQVGRRLHEAHGVGGALLGGRSIKIVDGSTVSMPDPRKW